MAASSTAKSSASPQVDVEAVWTEMASHKGGGGNWQTSIVDLLKLLDLDSSIGARKELGQELGVHARADGSAEENIALHRAVMRSWRRMAARCRIACALKACGGGGSQSAPYSDPVRTLHRRPGQVSTRRAAAIASPAKPQASNNREPGSSTALASGGS